MPCSVRALVGKYLERVFRATEEENRRTILASMPTQPGATLLDLGCADGWLSMRAAERVEAERVLGVESLPRYAEAARKRGMEISESDLGNALPYDDGTVDAVLSNQVIEHLCDTDIFMREIARVLAPGGYAVVSTNNLASWHNVLSLVFGWQPMPCHVSDELMAGNPVNPQEGSTELHYQMHRRVFTGRALAALATHHGLDVELQTTAGYYPLPPRAARAATRLDRRHGAFLVQRYRRRDG